MVEKMQGSATLPQEKRSALVIGVNSAPNAHDLMLRQELYAIDDAKAIAETLEKHGNFQEVTLLTGSDVTSWDLKQEILHFGRNRSDNDFLLLYFAGHGYVMGGDTYLVTHNFDEQEEEESSQMHLSMSWLRDHFYFYTGAGKVLLIFDCCYAGNIERASASLSVGELLDRLKARFNEYFDIPAPNSVSNYRPDMLRQALTATVYGLVAGEEQGHGIMTRHLLEILQGRREDVIDVNDQGHVKLPLIYNSLLRTMPETQKPDLSGRAGGKLCILATFKELAERIRQRTAGTVEKPDTYFPMDRNRSFQQRSGEFEAVSHLLFAGRQSSQHSSIHGQVVGLVGLGGVGKTQLALEVAYKYRDEQRFPAGIFWLTVTGIEVADLQYNLAVLCENCRYLPLDDDVSQPDNERKRARHLCRYLASHSDALLILDNVEHIDPLLETQLPALAGEGLRCSVLYTSRWGKAPPYVRTHRVSGLPEKEAWCLLLEYRPALLERLLTGEQDEDTQAARAICHSVEGFPLALRLLRDLLQDDNLTPVYLLDELNRRGTIAVTSDDQDLSSAKLFSIFEHSWKQIGSTNAQRLFKFAVYFPEAMPIPLWLLGLVADLSGITILDPFGRALEPLRHWGLVDVFPGNEFISIHPLLREFGQKLIEMDSDKGSSLVDEAGLRLAMEFVNIANLEKRVLKLGYWNCLGQVRIARDYLREIGSARTNEVELIEKWLGRESSQLADDSWWPERLPGLFYQQMYNRAVEEGIREDHLFVGPPPERWLRLEKPSGVEDRALLRVLVGHTEGVACATFSHDGRRVLTGSYDKTARIWDSESGQCLRVIEGHTRSIISVAFSSDRRRVLTGSDDETARIWDSESGQLLMILKDHRERVKTVAFSSDDTRVLTASDDKIVRLWDSGSGELLARFRCDALALDRHWKIVGIQNDVGIWDGNRRILLTRLEFDTTDVTCAAIVSASNLVALGTVHGKIQLWDYESHRPLTSLSGHRGWISSVSFSPDERLVLTGSEDATVRVWDRTTGEQLARLARHTGRINTVAFAPDGKRILTGAGDKTAQIWSYTGEISRKRSSDVTRTDVDKSADSGKTQFLNHVDNLKENNVHRWNDSIKGTDCAVFSPDGQWVLISQEHERVARIWDSDSGTLLTVSGEHSDEVTSAAFSPDGRQVLTISRDGFARIWDSMSGQDQRTWKLWYGVTSSMFSRDGSALLINRGTHAILWDVESSSQRIDFSGHEADVRSVAFSADGELVVTGSADASARIWDATTGYAIAVLKHPTSVENALFSPDRQRVLTYATDRSIRIWDRVQEHPLAVLSLEGERVYSIAFSPDSGRIAICCINGRLILLRSSEPALGEVLGTYLTHGAGAIHWPDDEHVILAGIGRSHNGPHFYKLKLGGMR